jgi:hypothetical protein
MRVPTSTDFINFNYVLAVIDRLSIDDWCSTKAVKDACAEKTFNAQIIDYHKVVQVIEYCDLVIIQKGNVSMTAKGKEFFNLNEQGMLELDPKQKHFLVENFIFNGRFKSKAKRIFNTFTSNYDEITYTFSWSNEIEVSIQDRVLLHIFEYLGIVIRQTTDYSVTPQYVKHVREIRAKAKGMSQEELERSLDAKRELGFRAEELIVEYEQKRLRELGLNAEADRVKRISSLDTDAGYDIKSFVGSGPTGEHDKFIEVKCSQKSGLEFYWTKNEIDIAKNLGFQYWIYFLADFRESTQLEDINPLAFKDPVDVFLNNPNFECEPRVFKVTESGDRKFKKLDAEARALLIR